MMFMISLVAKQIHFPINKWYKMTLDLIESRICNAPTSKTTKTKPKNLIKLHFVRKGIDMINIAKIINDKKRKEKLLYTTEQNRTNFNSIYIN